MVTRFGGFAVGIEYANRALTVGGQQAALAVLVGARCGQPQDELQCAVGPRSLAVERDILQADVAPIADGHLQRAVAIEIGKLHIANPFVFGLAGGRKA